MKKVISSQQIREADRFTIANEPIASIDLMERASEAFVLSIEKKISINKQISIVCGTGNNGGDGFAVSRILRGKGYEVDVYLIKFSDELSADCLTNYNKLNDVIIVESTEDLPDLNKYDLIIDAIFGSGLTRPVDGIAASTINEINKSESYIISIDIPSGMFCDVVPNSENIIKSDLTISFQRPKLSFFFPESGKYIKEWETIDIGLNERFIQQQDSKYFLIDEAITEKVKTRKRVSHKGNYGNASLIVGSFGKIGAAVLASEACLRSGAGLLTVHVPKCGYEIIQTKVPEAMCTVDINETQITTLPDLSKFNSIGIGPGIGTNQLTIKVIKDLFCAAKQPLVIDADALNIISQEIDLKNLIPINSILTPHPKEFERLVGKWTNYAECLEKLESFAKKYKCIVVLKGSNTCVCDSEGNLYFNTSGNSGMATGGSGDVLTGIITGLLAQGYLPIEAALIGVYFHGKAGDDAALQKGKNALIASDIIDYLKIEK